jgi:hypothetical protein
MKQLFLFLFITTSLFANAQDVALNQYKYIIVNNQYEFQNEANEYSLNELVVFELKKHNFKAFRNSEVLPADMNRGECNALQLKVDKSGTLRIFMVLQLVDCTGTVVFTSKKGVGTTKSNDRAYFEAIRDAMTSFDEMEYEYTPLKYIKTVQHGEGPDGVVVQTGQPEENVLEAKKEVAFQKPVLEEDVTDNQLSDLENDDKVAPTTLLKKDYVSTDKIYSLVPSKEGFNIYKSGAFIGTLKKSKSGSYLAVTSAFIGIAYETETGIFIEHTTDGKDQVIELVKQ